MITTRILEFIIPYIAGILELIGVVIIALGSLRAIFKLVKNGFKFGDSQIGIELTQALSMSLQFKLGAEILETVIVRSLDELWVLAAVIVLRVGIGLVLSWELKNAER